MKITFRGWRREVKQHIHEIVPVIATGEDSYEATEDKHVTWDSSSTVLGKIEGLNLTGSFLVEIEFSERELKNWLHAFAQAKPAPAIRLVADVQAKAMIALTRSTNQGEHE